MSHEDLHDQPPQKEVDPERRAVAIAGFVISMLSIVLATVYVIMVLMTLSNKGIDAALHYAATTAWLPFVGVPVVSLIKGKLFGTKERWVMIISTAVIAASLLYAMLT